MEDPHILRKRLVYQSHHRGMRELDFVLGRFSDKYIPSMSYTELKKFEALLVVPEQDLYGWLFEKMEVPEGPLYALVLEIQREIFLSITEEADRN